MSRSTLGWLVLACLLTTPLFGALNVPPTIVVEAEGPGGTIVGFTVTVVGGADGSDGRGADTVTCSPPPLSLFPIGSTTVSCIGSEGSTGSFSVVVVDTTGPQLFLPRDFTVVTSSPTGEPVSYTAVASDVVDGSVAISCAPPSGSTFGLGTTNVTCSASDSQGNTSTGDFNVTLATSPPPPGNPDLVAEATGPAGARVTFDTGDSEDDDGRPGSGGCSPVPGSLFPLGETTVLCPSGNFIVSVVDTTPPALTLPANISVVATGPSGAGVTFSATASDLVDGSTSVSCTPPSGSTFALGTTTVECTTSDSRSNSATGSFLVVVTADPSDLPDLTVEATGPGGAIVTFDAGEDGGGQPFTCTPASGSLFPLGATGVTCTSGASFTVTVVDTTPPDLTLPADLTFEATSSSGAAAAFAATASDLVDGSVAVVCTPPSGSTFAMGSTSVSCSATDANTNTSSGSFVVTIVDTTPPVLTLPADLSLEATGPSGAIATYTASATDLVDETVAVVCTPPSGSTFALGTTTVSCSATDAHDNTATGFFTVTVADTTPPEITSVTVSPSSIWPPNKKLVDVAVTVESSDLVDPAPLAQIVAITCDETIVPADAVITGALTAKLRADRDAHGDGRIYTLHVQVTDFSGNSSTATITVVVPHDSSDSASPATGPAKRRGGRP